VPSSASWSTAIRSGGAEDHGATISVYLRDPDGNGIELYYDRPRGSGAPQGRTVRSSRPVGGVGLHLLVPIHPKCPEGKFSKVAAFTQHLLQWGNCSSGQREERRKGHVRRREQALGRESIRIRTTGDFDAADEIYTSDYVNHQHHHPDDPRDLRGTEAMKTFATEFREAFPDFHDSIDIQIAEGDMHGGYSLHL
jgi:SnoaL-like polyketide cyclase